MKKHIALSLSLSLSLSLVAAETDSNSSVLAKKLADVSLGVSYTNGRIHKIDHVDIKTDPIALGTLSVVLLPNDWDITLGYSRTFTATADDKKTTLEDKKQAATQINIEVPLAKIGLNGWSILYDKYLFNTSLTPDGGSSVFMVSKENTSVGNHYKYSTSVSPNDLGITAAAAGEHVSAQTKRERMELRKYVNKEFAGTSSTHANNASGAYLALYYETLEKPFEESSANWSYGGNPATLIYADAKFSTVGIGFGKKIDDRYLDSGFQISKLNLDFGISNLDLTDNFNLKDRLSKEYKLARGSIGGELAYKRKIGFGDLVAGIYGTYDYYYIDDTSNQYDTAIDISNDYIFGARVSFHF